MVSQGIGVGGISDRRIAKSILLRPPFRLQFVQLAIEIIAGFLKLNALRASFADAELFFFTGKFVGLRWCLAREGCRGGVDRTNEER